MREPWLVSHTTAEGHLGSFAQGDGFGPPLPGRATCVTRPASRELVGSAMHLKRWRDPLPMSEGFGEQKGPHCFIQKV